MRIAVTVADCSHAVNAGGEVERRTVIIELHDEQIPELLTKYVHDRELANACGDWFYQSVSLSLIEDEA